MVCRHIRDLTEGRALYSITIHKKKGKFKKRKIKKKRKNRKKKSINRRIVTDGIGLESDR